MIPPEPSVGLINRIHDDLAQARSICVCAGFDLGKWRLEPLSRHLIAWMPRFALRPEDDPPHIGDWMEWVRAAAQRFFSKTVDPSLRGEIGELLLHIICRQQFQTYPSLSKVFYKSATNDVVKGFDLVHTKYDEDKDEIELWLGEAKFYRDGKKAISEAIASINSHLTHGFLQQEKALVGPLISQHTPGYKKLQWMFEDGTSLDEIVDRMIVPILITYDSKAVASFTNKSEYLHGVLSEMAVLKLEAAKAGQMSVELLFIYMPIGGKKALAKDFMKRLGAFT
jgi:hypothetical protein